MAEAGGAEIDRVVARGDEGGPGLAIGHEAHHEVLEEASGFGGFEKCAVGDEAGLLHEGVVAEEGEGIDGYL